MKVIKVINNNIVTSVDEENREIIVTGRGIGFAKKSGSMINDDKIEKIFRLEIESGNQRLIEIIKDIPMNHIKAAGQIVGYAKERLGRKLKDTIYLSLIDHINCAIDRYKHNIIYSNALIWEIKQYYPDEYMIGEKSLEILEDTVGIRFPEDEAGFIAFHFITAEYDTKMSVVPDIPKLIHVIVNQVELMFPGKIQKDSLHYERFITHLKFFIARLLQEEQLPDEDDYVLQSMIRNNYKKHYLCALNIRKIIEEEYFITISEEEVVFLTVHIKRITMKEG